MKIYQRSWSEKQGWTSHGESSPSSGDCLVLVFGGRDVLSNPQHFHEVRKMYPDGHIIMASSSGEIQSSGELSTDEMSLSAIFFDKTRFKIAQVHLKNAEESCEAGKKIAEHLKSPDLSGVFVISEGLKINGDALTRGISSGLDHVVPVTGGLSGDNDRFVQTLVGYNIPPQEGIVIGIGFYGSHIKIGHGCIGGWDFFGAIRKVTKSQHNVLYEVDGQSALQLYKTYLGDQAEKLPASGLLFPLSIHLDNGKSLVRTVLSVNESEGSMTYAGEIPMGARIQFMRANFDRLIQGASDAAEQTVARIGKDPCELAILVSCVGRKLVLGPRTEEEIESVRDIIGWDSKICGFYSYGEISPLMEGCACSLHNQTMTVTTFKEV